MKYYFLYVRIAFIQTIEGIVRMLGNVANAHCKQVQPSLQKYGGSSKFNIEVTIVWSRNPTIRYITQRMSELAKLLLICVCVCVCVFCTELFPLI